MEVDPPEVMHMKNVIYFLILSVALVSETAAQNLTDSGPNGSGPAVAGAKVVARKAADTVSFPYDGGRVRFLVNKDETAARFSLLEIIEPVGYKTPLHRHSDIDEAFYVIEGTLTAKIGEQDTQEFGPGSFVLIPRGTVHAQGNFGKAPVKLLITALPGGFEQFFADRVKLLKELKPGEAGFDERLKTVIENNHIEVLGPWVP